MLHINNISIHHIGYAVADIEKAYKVFLLMGYKKYEMQDIVDDYERNVRILMLKNGFILVELISFLDRNKKSPVDFWLGKNSFMGGAPYHICYAVDNIINAIDSLRKEKFIVVQSPCKAIALGNKLVSFLFHKDIGIIELVEEKI